jgi:hypothetical protein
MATSARREWTAIVIAGLALIVSLGSFVYTAYESKKQFAESGAVLNIKFAYAEIWNGRGSVWEKDPDPDTTIPFENMKAPYGVWAKIDVSNTGRSEGTITEAGFITGQNIPSMSPAVLCPQLNNKLQNCVFPTEIKPGREQVFYISESELLTQMTCNDYVRDNGLVAYAKTGTNKIISRATNVGVAYAGYCQKRPGNGNR